MDEYQSRYIAYAHSNGKTPYEMMEHDRQRYPGGCMCGFIVWINSLWRIWDELNPGRSPHTERDHDDFDLWLEGLAL
jgi:hypothetical protein